MSDLASSDVVIQGNAQDPEEFDQKQFRQNYLNSLPDNPEDLAAHTADVIPGHRAELQELTDNRPTPGWGGELYRGIIRGIDNLGFSAFAAAGAASQALGADDLADGSYQKMLDMQQLAEYNKPTVGEAKDIKDIDGAMRYAIGGITENLPMFLPGLVSGGIGGAIATKAAMGLAEDWALKHGAETAAKMVAKRIAFGQTTQQLAQIGGQALGTLASSGTIETGQIAGQIAQDTGGDFKPNISIPAGIIAGSLDALAPVQVLHNVFGHKVASEIVGQAAEQAVKKWGPTVAKNVLQTELEEVTTEQVQNFIENFAQNAGSLHPKDVSTPGNLWNVGTQGALDVFLKTALGTAPVGIAAGTAEHLRSPRLQPDKDTSVNQAQSDMAAKARELVPDDDEEGFDQSEEDQRDADRQQHESIVAQIEKEGETPELAKRRDELAAKIGTPTPESTTEATPSEPKVTQDNSQGESQLNQEAKDLIAGIDKGNAAPSFISKNLERIANENGVEVTDSMKPEDVISALREKQQSTKTASANVSESQDSPPVETPSKVQSPEKTLDEQIAEVDSQIESTGDPDRTLQARKKELEAAKISNPQSTEPTRTSKKYRKDIVTPEQVTAKETEIDKVSEKASLGSTNPEFAGKIKTAVNNSLKPVASLLAHANVKVQTRSEFTKTNKTKTPPHKYYVHYDSKSGNITLVLPEPRSIVESETKANRTDEENYVNNRTPKTIEEEVIHIAKLKSLQDEWEKNGSKGDRGKYMTASLKNLATAFRLSDPKSFEKLSNVYQLKNADGTTREMGDVQNAGELLRMIIQKMRTGSITEDINALDRLSREGGKNATEAKGALSKILDAIRSIRDAINRYIVNPTPAIKKVVDNTNELLDRHKLYLSKSEPVEVQDKSSVDRSGGENKNDTSVQREVRNTTGTTNQGETKEPDNSGLSEDEKNSGNHNLESAEDYSDPIDYFENTGEAPRTSVNAPLKKSTDDVISEITSKWEKALSEKTGTTKNKTRDQAFRALRNSPATSKISTQAQLPEMRRAMAVITDQGVMNVAEELSKSPHGYSLGFTDQDSAALTSLRYFTKAILDETVGHLRLNAKQPREITRLSTASASIIEAMQMEATQGGRATSILANLNDLMTGRTAIKHYVGCLYASIIGSNPTALRDANRAFRNAYDKIRDKVLTENEAVKSAISILRNSRNIILTPEGKSSVKKTQAEYVARDMERPNATPEDMGNWLFMAADDLASNGKDAVESFVKSIAGRISFAMPNFSPQSAERLILNAIHNSVAGPLTEAQIYGPNKKLKPPTAVEQIKMILSNPDMKSAMIDGIEKNVAEFYDEGMNDPAFQEHKELFDNLRKDTEVGDKAVGKAASEIMNKLRIKIPNLVRKNWTKAKTELETVKQEFRKELSDTAASDEAIDGVVDSLDKLINQRYEDALTKALSFKQNANGSITAGSTRDAISKFSEIMPSDISKDVQTIKDITKMSTADMGEYKENLADFYVRYLGLPNTKEHPLAQKAAVTMSKTLDALIANQSSKEKQGILDAAEALSDILPKKLKVNKEPVIAKIIHAANRGFLGEASLYEAFRKVNPSFNLPAYDQNFEADIRRRNDIISMLPFEEARQVEIQKLNREIQQKSKVSAKDLIYGYGYFAMLSGAGTQEVNVEGNMATIAPNILIWSAQNPGNIHNILGNLFFAATHQAKDAAVLAWKEGVDPSKRSKLFNSSAWENATQQNNPNWFKLTNPGKYFFRALDSQDAYFKRLTFYTRLGASGYSFRDKEARRLAVENARQEIKSYGIEDKSGKLAAIMADEAIQAMKNIQPKDLDIAQYKGLEGAYQQQPRGLWGSLSRTINEFAAKGEGEKFLKFAGVPFTDVVANIANETLNWGPFGLTRYVQSVWPEHWAGGIPEKWKQEWRVPSSTDPMGIADKDLLIKGTIGSLSLLAGMLFFTGGGDDDKNKRRYFDLYAGGPQDPQTREPGFKKWSMRIGNTYIPFNNIPCLAVTLGVLGSIRDAERKGKVTQGLINRAGYAMGAFLGVTMSQSYLSGLSDFASALQDVQNGKGMKSLEKWAVYNSVGRLNPGILKTINSMIDPSIPDTPSLSEMAVATLPFANLAMRPVLDYWGQPMQGQRLPTERVVSFGRDPLMQFLSSREIPLPGRGTPSVKGKFFNNEQKYEYNRLAGQSLRKAIESNLPRIERMDRDEATKYIQELSDESKDRAKSAVLKNKSLADK